MKKIFSNYYKIILSVVILVVLVALGEDYYTFDEMSGIWQVVRVLLYIAWGFPAGNKDQTGQSKSCGICCFCCCLCGCAQSANSHLEIPDSVLCFCRRCSGTVFYGIYPDRNVSGYIWGQVDKTDQ